MMPRWIGRSVGRCQLCVGSADIVLVSSTNCWIPPASHDKLESVRFCPGDATRTRLARENAAARLGGIIEGNHADRDFKVILNLFFDFAGAVPVGKGKPPLNFGFAPLFRIEKCSNLALGMYQPSMSTGNSCR